MKTLIGTPSAITERATARAAATVGERGPALLTETELDRVAAARGKKGVACGCSDFPPRPK